MNPKRLLIGTIGGGIVLFVVGYLMFSVAFDSFYRANIGSATGVSRASELLWATILGSLSYAALITYTIENRSGAVTVGTGAQIGAIVGFLLWFTADFVIYGTTNVANLTRTIVDPLLEIVHGGIGGAVIAAVLTGTPTAVVRPGVRT
jgi:hypothetical protein